MRKKIDFYDPVQSLDKMYKRLKLKQERNDNPLRFRLILGACLIMNVILYLIGMRLWWPVRVLQTGLTVLWMMDTLVVVLSAFTGAFAVADVPALKRTTILFSAMWRIYWQPPETALDGVKAALNEARKAHLAPHVLRIAQKLPPDVRQKIEMLVAAGTVDDAVFQLEKAGRDAVELQKLHQQLRTKAVHAACIDTVESLLIEGKTADAQHLIVRANILLTEAKQFGIREEIANLIAVGAFERADDRLRDIRELLARRGALQDLLSRIQQTPEEYHDELRRKLYALSQLEFESHNFRKARYALEKKIEKATGPRE